MLILLLLGGLALTTACSGGGPEKSEPAPVVSATADNVDIRTRPDSLPDVPPAEETVNGSEPEVAHTIEFTEELRFADDDITWSGLNPTVTVATDGTIYIADTGGNHILAYDAQGAFIRYVAGPGEGPGEFLELVSFSLLSDGRGVATGGRFGICSLHWFDDQMTFVRKDTPDQGTMMSYAVPAPNGQLFATQVVRFMPGEERRINVTREILTPDFETVAFLPQYQIPAWDGSRTTDPDYVVERAAQQMGGKLASRGLIAFDSDNHIYTARTGTYEITRWDPALEKKLLVIRRDYTPRAWTEEEIDSFVVDHMETVKATLPIEVHGVYTKKRFREGFEQAGISRYHNPLYGLLPMPDGHLLAIHAVAEGGRQTADIFDADGTYSGRVTMDDFAFLGTTFEPRMTFANGYAYTIETKADDSHELVRYSYRLTTVE